MAQEVFLSIIVPVYNVEDYIHQCIDSVLVQTLKNYEIILIDDGSSDLSSQICDEYADVNRGVIVLHKENGGLSSARNAGISIAKGEYLFFLDSDDFIEGENTFEVIYQLAIKYHPDVIIHKDIKFFESSGKYIKGGTICNSELINGQDKLAAIEYMIKENIYKADSSKIVKREVIESRNMRFREGFLSEDMDWCGKLLLYARSFAYVDQNFYIYRQQRPGAITYTNSDKLVQDKITLCREGLNTAKEMSDIKMGFLLGSFYAYEYAVCLGISRNIKEKSILDEMKRLSVLLKYDKSDKVRKVNLLKRFIGYTFTRWVLCAFVKLKN